MSKGEIVPGDTFYNMILNEKIDLIKYYITIKTGDFKDFIVCIDENKRAYINLFGKEKDLNTYDLLNSTFEIQEKDEIDIQAIKEFEIDKNGFIQTDLGAFKTRKMDIAFLNKINELIQIAKQLDNNIKEK